MCKCTGAGYGYKILVMWMMEQQNRTIMPCLHLGSIGVQSATEKTLIIY
jgi:hypothetical protein